MNVFHMITDVSMLFQGFSGYRIIEMSGIEVTLPVIPLEVTNDFHYRIYQFEFSAKVFSAAPYT